MFNFLKRNTDFVAIKSALKNHIKQIESKKSSIPEDVFDVTKFSLEEILKTFASMDILIQKNDFEGCIKLSRTILENSINLRYIYKEDTEKRAKNFKTASIKNLSDKFNTLEEPPIEAKPMNDYFQSLLKDYIPEKNMREKFKSVGSDDTYIRSYKRLSEYIHPVYRPKQINFNENSPYIVEMKRTVRSDTIIIVLTALQDVCTRYNLDGGIMMIDDMDYKATVFFATNPKKAEESIRNIK